jgi:hypothetical protein
VDTITFLVHTGVREESVPLEQTGRTTANPQQQTQSGLLWSASVPLTGRVKAREVRFARATQNCPLPLSLHRGTGKQWCLCQAGGKKRGGQERASALHQPFSLVSNEVPGNRLVVAMSKATRRAFIAGRCSQALVTHHRMPVRTVPIHICQRCIYRVLHVTWRVHLPRALRALWLVSASREWRTGAARGCARGNMWSAATAVHPAPAGPADALALQAALLGLLSCEQSRVVHSFYFTEEFVMQMLECPPLGEQRIKRMYESIDAWLRSPALSALVNCFDATLPSTLSTVDLGAWLLGFSETWDYRQQQQRHGGARWEVDDASLTPARRQMAKEAASKLGLIGQEIPGQRMYDVVWVLGGARLSCLLRSRLAARLLTEHGLQCGMLALLSSARRIAETERQATDTYAPEAQTEFDVMNKGAERAFGLPPTFTEERCDDTGHPNSSWIIRTYEKQKSLPPLFSLSAPSSRPYPQPANSADTYTFFFEHFSIPSGATLLLITSQIYVPYQQLEAIRTIALPQHVVVETVGFPLEWGGNLQGMLGASNYLQEIRSTIQSANRFFRAFPEI